MLIRDLMKKDVITIEEEASVTDAARLMGDNRVGCLVVSKNKKVQGIITERDILTTLADNDGNVENLTVHDAMTHYVFVVSPNQNVAKAVKLMKENNIKKVPVVENDILVGIITTSDIIINQPELIKEVSSIVTKRGK